MRRHAAGARKAAKPREERPRRGAPFLERLYGIVRLLDGFEGVEASLPGVLSAAAEAVPVCGAVLIEKRRGRPRVLAWHAPSQGAASVRAARTNALSEYRYLAGTGAPPSDPEIVETPLAPLCCPTSATGETPGHYVVLPLVTDRLPIFGALQFESGEPLDRPGLAFVSALTNLLSMALDRYYTRIEHSALLAETVEGHAIFMLDPEGNVSSWNAGAEKMTGYAAEEVVGRHLSAMFPSDAAGEAAQELEEAAKNGRSEREGEKARKDGSRFWARCVTTALRGADGRLVGFARSAQDMTELRRTDDALRSAERQAREHTKKLEEAVADLEAFSHTVSHNLRGPLRAVQGYAYHLVKNAGAALDAESRRMLDRLSRATVRMDRLIHDLLAYSRIKRAEYVMAPVDLDPLVAHVVEDYPGREQAEIRRRGPLGKAMGQESLVTQALSNLLENALKFVPAARKPEIEIWSERIGDRVRLNIRDNGIGVAKEYQKKIFEPFTRLEQAEKFEGTGIGLTIVKKAVERMGGTVGVESAAGKGSRFWIDLPAAD